MTCSRCQYEKPPGSNSCHLGLGKLYRCTGKRQDAQEHLTTVAAMCREAAMTYWLEQAETETRELA